jgi:hypothetical protein
MSKDHRLPPKGLVCKAYYIDIDRDSYVEYQTSDELWHPSPYCDDVVLHLLETGFEKYIEDIDKSTCKSGLKRIIKNGPPLYLDDGAFEISEEGLYIQKVWFLFTDKEIDAKYKGAPEGEGRIKMMKEHQLLLYKLPDEEEEEVEVESK